MKTFRLKVYDNESVRHYPLKSQDIEAAIEEVDTGDWGTIPGNLLEIQTGGFPHGFETLVERIDRPAVWETDGWMPTLAVLYYGKGSRDKGTESIIEFLLQQEKARASGAEEEDDKIIYKRRAEVLEMALRLLPFPPHEKEENILDVIHGSPFDTRIELSEISERLFFAIKAPPRYALPDQFSAQKRFLGHCRRYDLWVSSEKIIGVYGHGDSDYKIRKKEEIHHPLDGYWIREAVRLAALS